MDFCVRFAAGSESPVVYSVDAMTSNCRNIWDSLRAGDLATNGVSNQPNSVTHYRPDVCAKVPFTSTSNEGKLPGSINLSKNSSQERCAKRKYDDNFMESLPKRPAIYREAWSCDSRKNGSLFHRLDCLQKKNKSDNHIKIQDFYFKNVQSSSPLSANLSRITSNRKSVMPSSYGSLHNHASVIERHQNVKVSPINAPAVKCMNSFRSRDSKDFSKLVVNKDSVQLNSEPATKSDDLRIGAATNRSRFPVTMHVQKHSRYNYDPILSQAEFGDYLRLNGANYISEENHVTDFYAKWKKESVKCDVITSAADLISRTVQEYHSRPVVECKEVKLDDSCDMYFEMEKSAIHDAVVPVLVPENSPSIGVGRRSTDRDVETESLSETEDIPSFRCPFDADEIMNVDETNDPGLFSGTDLLRNSPVNSYLASNASAVGTLHSAACDLATPVLSSSSVSSHISPVQLMPKSNEGRCTRNCINDKSNSFVKSDEKELFVDKNAYSELQQLYQSKQLSVDSPFLGGWSDADKDTSESASRLETCTDHLRPCDDASDSRTANIRLDDDENDSERDIGNIRNVVEEVLGFLATEVCCHTDSVSKAKQRALQKADFNQERNFKNLNKSLTFDNLDSDVPLPDSSGIVAMSNANNLTVSSPLESNVTPTHGKPSKTSIGVLDPVSHSRRVTLDSESCIPPADIIKLAVHKLPHEDSVVHKEIFVNEKQKVSHDLDLYLESSPREIFSSSTGLKKFSSTSEKSLFIPELNSSLGNGKLSENAISPCSMFPIDKCFLDHRPVHNEDMAKSSSDPNQAAVNCVNGSELRTSLSELDDLSILSSSPLSAETNFVVTNDSALLQNDSGGNEKNFQDSCSESGYSELSENPNYTKIDKHSRTFRRPRLLSEIANSNGYITEKKKSHSGNSLFVDSKLLSREERALQVIHMQITKMEVKEELIKLKKTKTSAVSHNQKPNRRLKSSSSLSCTSDGKRLNTRNIWLSRKFKRQQNFSSCYKNIQCSQRTRDKKIARAKRKLRIANKVRNQRSIDRESNVVNLCDKNQAGSSAEQQNGNASELEALHMSVNGANSFVVSSAVLSNAESSELKRTFNGVESLCLSAPFVPSEVKRVIACHSTGETILHKAARLGYVDVALWCCQSGFVDVNACDNAGYTPLHESCLNSQLCITKYLIHYGADVNRASGVDGRRPIHEAVESGCLETVRLLLSAGADVDLTSYSGDSLLEISKSQEMKEFLKAYISELNGLNSEDTETEWQFVPFWNDDPASSSLDLLCDVPPCDPKCDEFYVELAVDCFKVDVR